MPLFTAGFMGIKPRFANSRMQNSACWIAFWKNPIVSGGPRHTPSKYHPKFQNATFAFWRNPLFCAAHTMQILRKRFQNAKVCILVAFWRVAIFTAPLRGIKSLFQNPECKKLHSGLHSGQTPCFLPLPQIELI